MLAWVESSSEHVGLCPAQTFAAPGLCACAPADALCRAVRPLLLLCPLLRYARLDTSIALQVEKFHADAEERRKEKEAARIRREAAQAARCVGRGWGACSVALNREASQKHLACVLVCPSCCGSQGGDVPAPRAAAPWAVTVCQKALIQAASATCLCVCWSAAGCVHAGRSGFVRWRPPWQQVAAAPWTPRTLRLQQQQTLVRGPLVTYEQQASAPQHTRQQPVSRQSLSPGACFVRRKQA
jgi:hypothetical protein